MPEAVQQSEVQRLEVLFAILPSAVKEVGESLFHLSGGTFQDRLGHPVECRSVPIITDQSVKDVVLSVGDPVAQDVQVPEGAVLDHLHHAGDHSEVQTVVTVEGIVQKAVDESDILGCPSVPWDPLMGPSNPSMRITVHVLGDLHQRDARIHVSQVSETSADGAMRSL